MARKCQISGRIRQIGHRVSHANNKTLHAFKVNLITKRLWVAEEKKFVRVRVATNILRTIDKLGLPDTLKKYKITLADLQ